MNPDVSEADFQLAVIDLAHVFDWHVASFRTAMNARGQHMTPVAADGKGWPDLFLAHRTAGCMALELKSAKGRVSPEQNEWLNVLNAAGIPAHVVRPADWDRIQELLNPARSHQPVTALAAGVMG